MSALRPFRLALHSAAPRLGDVEANVAAVAKAVLAKEADLVAFPEMFLTGYAIGDDAQRLALRLDDERLEPLLKAAKKAKAHVVVGGPRTPRAGLTHNSAFLIAPGGEVEAYDKRSLATFTTFQEALFFKPGREAKVWETDLGNIGLGICYDLFFPEANRRQALAGADLLLNVSASPTTSQRFFEALLPARAIENACFTAYSNLVGAQDGIVFWGGAQAHGPRGDRLGRLEPMQPGRIVVAIDPDDLVPAREFRPTLRDADEADLLDLPC
ncbi:MAG TPA: carbon-nitrogen hydrolase family protein [Candidatus Thermoplasmatota archaeon]|nr:carbon-nitrogen hydrolase family protein [Candidatus Thermoplasmatota archaeon]